MLGAATQPYIKLLGQIVHPRSLYGRGGQSISWLRQNVGPRAERIPMPAKLKYVWSYDPELRERLQVQAQPYPKREAFECTGSVGVDAPGFQPGEGGSTPTRCSKISSSSRPDIEPKLKKFRERLGKVEKLSERQDSS